MNRRTFLAWLGVPALLGASGIGYSAMARSRNPYYQGPVSDHFDGVRFFMPGGPSDKGLAELLRWHMGGGREAWPETFPSPFRDTPPPRVDGLRVALVGHAAFLIQVAGLNVLTDPVFVERASPFQFAGPRRVNPPGIAFDDLPRIDVVLITHNHYDHLDLATLARLWRRDRPRIVAPLGNDAIVRGHDPDVAVEARDWGEAVALSPEVTAHLVPAFHWSARGLNDRRMALWASYLLETPHGPIYHVGDTGYGDGSLFRDLRDRFGPVRLALLPIGAYEPRWFMQAQHVNPADSVQIMLDTGAAQVLGHHWGTFRLTNEAIDHPLRDLAAALEEKEVPPERFRPMRPGEVWQA
ncbi:MAG TPA: MBL fold metallo-hydrolase [Beijerinckiaceae bacterium]|nr:MBL fold metallo-hydrolase [Beijerinckiaceae bacterium]